MTEEKSIHEFTIPLSFETIVLRTPENTIKIRFGEYNYTFNGMLESFTSFPSSKYRFTKPPSPPILEKEKENGLVEEWRERKRKELNHRPPSTEECRKILLDSGREEKCELCGTTEYLCVHHKDWNQFNVKPENLMFVNYDCHYGRLHAKGMKKPRDTEEANRIIEEIKKSLL